MRKTLMVVGFLSLALIGIFASRLFSQQPLPNRSNANSAYRSPNPLANQPVPFSSAAAMGGMPLGNYTTYPVAGTFYDGRPVDPEEMAQATKFHKEVAKLRAAQTDKLKDEARANLSEMVTEQLERDIAQREKALADIEQRVKEMRAQLEERKKSKPEIQKMIMLMIEQPQVGMGLPRAWMDAIAPQYPTFPESTPPTGQYPITPYNLLGPAYPQYIPNLSAGNSVNAQSPGGLLDTTKAAAGEPEPAPDLLQQK